MIKRTFYKTNKDGTKLYMTKSDSGKYIKQTDTGRKYVSAIDPEGTSHIYVETNEYIEERKQETDPVIDEIPVDDEENNEEESEE